MKRASRDELAAEIQGWNERNPVGTAVGTKLYPERSLKTRTEAMTLFDQKAVIYLEGFNGYFDLCEVWPAGEAPGPSARAADAQAEPDQPATGQAEPDQAEPDQAEPDQADVAVPRSLSESTPSEGPVVEPVTRPRIVAMFPGQGAQNKGMGKQLFAAFPEQTARASEILGYSIEELCILDSDGKLNQTQFTQPALYVVGALGYLQHQRDESACARADLLMGHSLGEYNALFAAGAIDFETGLRLVKKRGELMAEATGGAMAAVVRIDPSRIREVLAANGLDSIDLANFNTPTQTVISGPTEEIAKAIEALSKEKCVVVQLKVSAAFHSRYMQVARDTFSEFLKDFSFSELRRPVVANATARPYTDDNIAATLSAQIASPVQWTDSVRYVLGLGEAEFIEVGSNILSKMVGEIRAAS